MNVKYSRHIFERYSDIKFRANVAFGSRVAACGRADGRKNEYTEGNSRNSRFSNAPKHVFYDYIMYIVYLYRV